MPITTIEPRAVGLAQQNSIFTFTVNTFSITETRSEHNDTDFVSVSVAVGNKPPVTLPTKAMGNVNNGTFHVNLSIPDIEVGSTDRVAFVYAIVNTGFNQNAIEQKIKAAVAAQAEKAVTEAAKGVGTIVLGDLGGTLGSVIGQAAGPWLVDKVLGVVFADCDGPVAAASHAYSGAQLAHQTAAGKVISSTDDNRGSDSPWGCGSNSHYTVSWSISGHPKALTEKTQ